MQNIIKKAIIPAAGLGTRFLPATKAIPKEMLPIVDIPTIQHIVLEAVQSGIETIVLVTARGKESIIDHFDDHMALEEKLMREGKEELADRIRTASQMAKIVSVRQGVPRGLGHAVLCAKEIIGDEPFVVLLGDDLVDSEVPCTRQLVNAYEQHKKSVVALMEVEPEDVSKFGIASGENLDDKNISISQMVEKPKLEDAPSRNAIVGRYLLTPRIFELLEKTDPGAGGEIQLTDAMEMLRVEEGFVGHLFDGHRYDAGDTLGFVKANIAYALKRPDIRERLISYLKEISAC